MQTLRLSPFVLLTPHDDGYLAFDVTTRTLHRLNVAAALLLELGDGTRTIDQLDDCLSRIGCVDEGRRAWLESAVIQGLLQPVHADMPPAPGPSADALASLADELRERDDVLPAFICQQHAAERAPDEAVHWLRLGELAHIVDRRDVARDAYERYHARCPEDAEVAHILTALRDAPPPARASNECIEQLYARFASFYDDNMTGDLDYRAPDIVGEMLERATDGRGGLAILDLGCGTGLGGQRLRPRAARLVGVDLSPAMIERARGRGIYDELHTAEITSWLTAHDQRYDAIVACDTLIYFGDLEQILRPAARLLAAGGTIAFTVERSGRRPFRLTDSGRYAHHADHIRDAAAAANLRVLHVGDCVPRYEYGEPVAGHAAVLTCG